MLGAALALVPYLRSNIRLVQIVWGLVGFLPFVLESFHLYMSAGFLDHWPGYVTGFELTIVDALALALYLSLPRTSHPLPFRIALSLYLFSTLLSALPAMEPKAALFYSWQLARMFFLYAVIVRASANPVASVALLKGMAVGLLVQVPVVLWQRFALGMLQTPGTMVHQNELGMLSHFIVFPFFALLLTGRAGRWPALVSPRRRDYRIDDNLPRHDRPRRDWIYARFCVIRPAGMDVSKGALLAVFVVVSAIVAPVAVSAIADRGASQIESSDMSRVVLEKAASLMLADHPMGVGANNFNLTAILQGYYQRAGVDWSDYIATVHNFYWLTAAENGYFGLLTCVMFLLFPLIVALRCGVRYRQDIRGDLLIGLAVAVLAVYLQSFEEWVFVTYRLQYVYVMDVGLIAGMATQLGYWRRPAVIPIAASRGMPTIGARVGA